MNTHPMFSAAIRPFLRTLSLLVCVWMCACEDAGEDPKPICSPNEARTCSGPGACKGMKTCDAAGSGFGECLCKASDGGPGDASMSDGQVPENTCKRFVATLPSTCPLDIPCPCGGGAIACTNNDMTCPWTTSCSESACVCPSGHQAVSCATGHPCWDGSCTDQWGCVPLKDVDIRPGCADPLIRISGVCECTNGQRITVGCGSLSTCEALCRGDANTARDPLQMTGEGVPEKGICQTEGQMKCGTSATCSETKIALVCSGGMYERAFSCPASCIEVAGTSSIRCEANGISYAVQGKPCATDGAAACPWNRRDLLTCTSGTWKVTTNCSAAQQCAIAKAGEGTCPVNATQGCLTCK